MSDEFQQDLTPYVEEIERSIREIVAQQKVPLWLLSDDGWSARSSGYG